MDALDLDHSYCARCETYIWPEKRQTQVQVAAKPTPKTRADETVTKTRTVISLDRAPLYCSEKCRQLDLESGSANGRRIMEHFESSCSPSPVSPSDRSQHNMDYFTRIAGGSLPWTRRPSTTSTRSTTSMSSMELLEEHRQWSRSLLAESAERLSRSESRAAISTTTLPKPKSRPERKPLDEPTPVPFTHRRWKDSKRSETLSRSIDVDVAALYDQYPMSQRVRSTSSIGSSVRRGSMTASTASDTASICTTSSRGSTRGTLSADATRGLLVPAVMIRQDSDERSTHSSDDEPEYFVRRNRTITQHTSKRRDQPHKTIQELVRDAAGPDFTAGPRPTEEHTGPLYEVTLTPPGPTRRHVVHAVKVDGKEELRIVQEDRWEEPQKLFHFNV